MTLRSRLSLYFVAIVVVPLAGVAVAAAVLVPREVQRRADERLRGAAASVAAIRAERLERATHDVGWIARSLAAVPPSARPARLHAARNESGLDFLLLGNAISARDPQYTDSMASGTDAAVTAARGGVGALRVTASMPSGPPLHGGWFTDTVYAKRLAEASGVGVILRNGSRTIASTPVAPGSRRMTLSDGGTASMILVAPQRGESSMLLAAIGLIAFAGLGIATLLGFAIARALARPLRDLAEHAMAIARGKWDRRVPEGGGDEVAAVGKAFNEMAASVQAHLQELRSSRDELRHTLERLGATLRSTRGMEEMLRAVLEAAAKTLGAAGGALFRTHADGALYVESQIGLDGALTTREVSTIAARDRRPILGSGLDGDDPLGRTVVAAPLHRNGDVVGVVALYGAGVPEPFDEHDLSTLSSFAAQASVAIDNVFLREEAEHLALTDPLTGIPNRRAMERLLESEAERAIRYGSKTSILMIDLDHFKEINDRFGHLDGDRVLVETCRRIGSAIRTGVDTLARYGGEEFVLILPETPASGAVTVAEKILTAMSETPFAVAGGRRLTVSIGVASLPGDGPRAGDALHAADLALYRAKQAGRNRIAATSVAEAEVTRT